MMFALSYSPSVYESIVRFHFLNHEKRFHELDWGIGAKPHNLRFAYANRSPQLRT